MPEPVAYCEPFNPSNADAFAWPGTSRRAGHTAPLFTADQMRVAILGATERAAKKVEEVGPKEGALKLVTEGFAAAIRGAAPSTGRGEGGEGA